MITERLHPLCILFLTISIHFSLVFLSLTPKSEQKDHTPNKETVIQYKKIPRQVGIKKSNSKNLVTPAKKAQKKEINWSLLNQNRLSNLRNLKMITPKEEVASRYDQADDHFKIGMSQLKKAQQRRSIKKLQTNPSYRSILKNKNFNMKVQPPKGVSEDKLNSFEKIYYSFNKRIFESFLNSYLSNYQKMVKRRPFLEVELQRGQERLIGKAVYDQEGNIISVKILKSSLSDNIHALFEKVLLNINTIKNPPPSILNSDKEFTVYYHLNIN